MNRLLRYWNQNRKRFLIIVSAIVFIIIVIQILNAFAKQQNNIKPSKNTQGNIKDSTKPTQSVITGQKLPTQITQDNTELIEKFVDFCNNKEVEQAYELLSNDCKNQVFNNDIEKFKQRYYNNIFKTKKIYNLELWLTESNIYTYKILYYDDNLLETGGSNIKDNIEDYITVVKNNNQIKLNLNGFIKREIFNKSETASGVEVIINSKNIYRNYEEYNITLKNNTDNTIIISDGENQYDICLLDANDLEYVSFIEELPEYNLSLNARRETNLNINFDKIYDVYRNIKKIKFSNINLGDEFNKIVEIEIQL